jgi:oxygen-independent coproporphyrinogen-3 oxidase
LSGIYIHIPFCKQACIYCNFYFSSTLKYKEAVVNAIIKEIWLRKNYLQNKQVNTIYLGGGTPSLLNETELNKIFEALYQNFDLSNLQEVTLEANPDDISDHFIHVIKNTPVNRLSIGVQSFFDEDLKWMNRAHSAAEAEGCIKKIQDAGFNILTIDLIYGLPTLSMAKWEKNLQMLAALNLPHFSSYCLTVEPKTALEKLIQKHKYASPDETQATLQFEYLMQWAQQNNFYHYEISNFATSNNYAIHNTNYWKGKHYLGIGPSAHSYNGFSRSRNVANNHYYIKAIENNMPQMETETLTPANRFNEYIMTSLRTMWGADLNHIAKTFGENVLTHLLQKASNPNKKELLLLESNRMVLTAKGKLFADAIAADLFI